MNLMQRRRQLLMSKERYDEYITVTFKVGSDTTQNIFYNNRVGMYVRAILDGVEVAIPTKGSTYAMAFLSAGTHILRILPTNTEQNRTLLNIDNVQKIEVGANTSFGIYRAFEVANTPSEGLWWYRADIPNTQGGVASATTSPIFKSTLYISDPAEAKVSGAFKNFSDIRQI